MPASTASDVGSHLGWRNTIVQSAGSMRFSKAGGGVIANHASRWEQEAGLLRPFETQAEQSVRHIRTVGGMLRFQISLSISVWPETTWNACEIVPSNTHGQGVRRMPAKAVEAVRKCVDMVQG